MTMFPQAIGPIPAETARITRAAHPKGPLAMWLRDGVGAIYTDEELADLYPERGQPARAPWRLAGVTLLQDVEDLTDRQAAEAVRERLDWKSLLGVELSDPGFEASVLAEWRQRWLAQGAEQRLLDKLLQVCRERGWLKAGGKMRTDRTHVLAAVRRLHHLETVGETRRAALEELAEVAPDWLVSWLPQAWFKRSEGRLDNRRLPKQEQERRRLSEQSGREGVQLLKALAQADVPAAARELESVQVLHLVWPQYYEERQGQVSWRDGPAQGAQETVVSPYDPDARLAQKRDTAWCGYKGHLTETCEPDLPELVVQVKTQLAPRPDVKETLALEQELAQRQPAGLRIGGPVPPDTRLSSLGGTRL